MTNITAHDITAILLCLTGTPLPSGGSRLMTLSRSSVTEAALGRDDDGDGRKKVCHIIRNHAQAVQVESTLA